MIRLLLPGAREEIFRIFTVNASHSAGKSFQQSVVGCDCPFEMETAGYAGHGRPCEQVWTFPLIIDLMDAGLFQRLR
jgi:hypothetical protein